MTELTPPLTVRSATSQDAGAVASIQVASLVDSVVNVVGQQYRDQVASQLSVDDIEKIWSTTISQEGDASRGVLVARNGEEVVGFAAYVTGTASDEVGGSRPASVPGLPFDVPTSSAQILAFEVEAESRRNGHGSRLLAAIADSLRPSGCPGLVIWIVGDDQARVRFFEKAGFAPVGLRRSVDTGVGEVVEHLWFAALTD